MKNPSTEQKYLSTIQKLNEDILEIIIIIRYLLLILVYRKYKYFFSHSLGRMVVLFLPIF